MNSNNLSLSELNSRIKDAMGEFFPATIWVIAEISEIHSNSSGHCYLELIEKDQISDRIIAKIRATIWAYTFRMLKPYFETTTGYELTSGLKVLLSVNVEFHEVYGISLNIKDIDPKYTLGDLARKKQEIIERLKKEGVFDMNKELDLPLVPQRIAVISSKTAAGYGDFMNTLEKNNFGLKYHITLFSAIVQGELAENSIIQAFEQIYENYREFDVVVLIRGGGSQSDLECFNNYELAYIITQFPLPVITGIGHERDVSIADLVAHTSVKTPTAAASFLIDSLLGFLNLLESYEASVIDYAQGIISEKKNALTSFGRMLKILTNARLTEQGKFLKNSTSTLISVSKRIIRDQDKYLNNSSRTSEIHFRNLMSTIKRDISFFKESTITISRRFIKINVEKLQSMEKTNRHLDPAQILKRGFSISSYNGKAIKDPSFLQMGSTITTTLYNGSLESKISKVNKKNKQENEQERD